MFIKHFPQIIQFHYKFNNIINNNQMKFLIAEEHDKALSMTNHQV